MYGPCKPNIEFPQNEKHRKFSSDYYFTMSKSGNKIPRTWLCYSIILNKIYCETCWLFADRSYKHYNSTWVYGIDDWQHASQKIYTHDTSVQHIEAIKIRCLWAKNQVIENRKIKFQKKLLIGGVY